MKRREQSNLVQTQVGLRQMLEGKDWLAAPAKLLATLLPCFLKAKAKAHAKTKAKPKKAARSESTDSKPDKSKKHIRCKFHFTDAACRNGDKCPFSHSKKTPEAPTLSRTPSPSGRTSNQVCFTFRKTGSCSRENCPFKHEAAAATPATPAPKPEAKAKPKADAKPKSEPSAAAKKTPKSNAKPAAPAIRMCRAWNPLAPASGSAPRTWQMTSQNALLLIATQIRTVQQMMRQLVRFRRPRRPSIDESLLPRM